jgi:hypothetical protein
LQQSHAEVWKLPYLLLFLVAYLYPFLDLVYLQKYIFLAIMFSH